MLKKYFACCVFLSFCLLPLLNAQDLEYYLPSGTKYDPAVPSPKSILGYEIGDWHIRHDQIVQYMHAVAQASPRVTIVEYARSYEQRPLLLLTITTVENQENIEAIKTQRQGMRDPEQSEKLDLEQMPAVVYMGYTIHGDESSGANAAPLLAYYLAAAQGEEVEALLQKTVVLLDPCMNPDGAARFASWANTHKSKNLVADRYSREHNQQWPSGRTNHYWFDLNRDWLLVQHPESQGKIAQFQEWLPNILTDHHEMGPDSTYFFQPGVPSRTHPLTPAKNYALTEKIAQFHAKELDQIGSLYYTKEIFDDFYYGKGSTYPDVQGCIGILFEQAGSDGHLRESQNGLLDFRFTIRNQVKTSFSTLAAAKAMRNELLQYQRSFYSSVWEEAQVDKTKAYIVGDGGDPARLFHFIDLLQRHHINVYKSAKDLPGYASENSYLIPLEQAQYRLIRAIFEKRTTFEDSSFYDVSAWTLPLAFNLPHMALTATAYAKEMLGEKLATIAFPKGTFEGKSEYAYLFSWNNYYAPRALSKLLNQEFLVKVAMEPFTVETIKETRQFTYGAIMVPLGPQGNRRDELHALMQNIAEQDAIDVYAVKTGLTPGGADLGSPHFPTISSPNALLLVGYGANSYEAGEVWHLLDQRFDMPLTMVDVDLFGRLALHRYNTILLVDGNYNLGEEGKQKLRRWIASGGTLVVSRNAVKWAADNGFAQLSFVERTSEDGRRSYGDLAKDLGSQVIGGAIVQTQLDLSHPINYGYTQSLLSVFRRGTLFINPAQNPYATPSVYSAEPLLGGYVSPQNLALLKNSAAIVICGLGSGRVICLADNANFRAFWYGTNRIYSNALFFGRLIRGSAVELVKED